MALRRTVARMLRHQAVNRELAGEISGFDLSCPVPLSGFEALHEAQDVRAGTRVPDADLVAEDGAMQSICAGLANGRWLMPSNADGMAVPTPDWLTGPMLNRQVGNIVGKHTVLHGTSCALIRPDGYIAAARMSSLTSRSAASGTKGSGAAGF